MPTPVLATKLYIPPHRTKIVPRPRLIERLNEGLHRKLTILSTPQGLEKLRFSASGSQRVQYLPLCHNYPQRPPIVLSKTPCQYPGASHTGFRRAFLNPFGLSPKEHVWSSHPRQLPGTGYEQAPSAESVDEASSHRGCQLYYRPAKQAEYLFR